MDVEQSRKKIGLATVEFDTGRSPSIFEDVVLLSNGWVEVTGEDGDTMYYSPEAIHGVYPHD